MALPRPGEVLTALRRLGFKDRPGVGDHIDLFKSLDTHPQAPITLHTGIDGGHVSKRDVARIKRQTKLSDDMWERALNRQLTQADYEAHLNAMEKRDLVPEWWRDVV
ncbi:MAG TPA: hypothetical protein VM345_15705 [Acidimicrobiales bacterium]|nr:hypothetical protein [Acidimicrobiales bacterium]